MNRKDFLKLMALAPVSVSAMNLNEFAKLTHELPTQSKKTSCVIYLSR